jgi:hypothetical protein
MVANRPARRAQEVLPLGHVVGVHFRQRTERLQVRQVDRPFGRQRVAALGHEAHAAEHDQVGVDVARAHRQLEAVTDGVRDGLYLGHLVVVRGERRRAFRA